MCVCALRKITKDAILTFRRDACAPLDRVVTLPQVSPNVLWTARNLFVFIWLKKIRTGGRKEDRVDLP